MQRKSIKTGDVIKLGDHVLGCGDATDQNFVSKVIGKHKIDVILTDPPYGIDYVQSKKGFSDIANKKDIKNDGYMSDAEYSEFTQKWLEPVFRHMSEKNSIYIFNSDKMIFALRDGLLRASGRFTQLLVWIKNTSVMARLDYMPQHELILYGWYGRHKFRRSQDKSILCCPKPSKSKLHPTTKPIALLRKLILNSSEVGEVVYDCFGGSGSTLIACEHTKRRCIMIEQDPEYCQTIINRYYKIHENR